MNNFWKERGAKAIPVWWTKSVKAFRQKNTSGVWYIGASGRKGRGIGVFGRKTEKSVFWVDGRRPWVRAKESGFYQPGFCKLFEHRGETMLTKLHLVWDTGEESSGKPQADSAEDSRHRATEAEYDNPGSSFWWSFVLLPNSWHSLVF